MVLIILKLLNILKKKFVELLQDALELFETNWK
jgi:hypothetical protein